MITTGGARELAPCLEGLTKLQKLSMESNLIGNAGCNAIAQALKKNISLREIYLYNNELTCDGLFDLADMLVNKKQLTTIGLEYNRIRARGCNKIMESIEKLP